jgi:phage shock protein E
MTPLRTARYLTEAMTALLLVGALAVASIGRTHAAEPVAAKQPTVNASPVQAPSVMTPMSQEALLEHQSKHADHLFVLDVRTPEEFAAGHVPGAVNIPHEQMAARIGEVPQDKDVVLYCKSGRRAALAADVLAAKGYTRLSHLEGDMPAWIEQGRPVAKP